MFVLRHPARAGLGALCVIVALGSLIIVHSNVAAKRAAVPALTAVSAGRYGLSTVGLSYPFAAAIAKGFSDAAARAGATSVVLDAKGSIQKQANDIDDLLSQRMAGIAVMPLDSVVAQGWVARAHSKGVPIASVAAQIGDPKHRQITDVYPGLVALVTQNEVTAGEAAGTLAAGLLPPDRVAKIAIVEGAAGFPEVEQRARGFVTALTHNFVRFRIVSSQPGNWTSEGGEAACQNMLAAHPDIDLLFNEADDMVVGCARAVRSAGSHARLIGVGGSKLAIASIKAGAVDGTVCFKPEKLGALAFQALRQPAIVPANRFVTEATPAVTRSTIQQCSGQW